MQHPPNSADVQRALASIEKGHELEGQHLTAEDVERVQLILGGELSPEDARMRMHAALEALVNLERGGLS